MTRKLVVGFPKVKENEECFPPPHENMVFLYDSYHIKLSSWKDLTLGEQSFKQDQPLTMYIQCTNNVYSIYILTLQHSLA